MTPTPPNKSLSKWEIYGLCLLLSLVFLFIFGNNSPLYAFNPNVDFQWYQTMGNSWLAGKVPYRDLFEQKGPITYAVAMFCCWCGNAGLVTWLLEILCCSIFLFIAYRIGQLWLTPRLGLWLPPVLMVVVGFSCCQVWVGGAVEEFCLPLFAYATLCFLELLLQKREFSPWRSLAMGVMVSVLFWVKFTMLYALVAPLIIWLVLSAKQHWPIMLRNLGLMLVGFLVISLPVMLGFGLAGALRDLWQVYFYNNIFLYNSDLNVLLNVGQWLLAAPLAVAAMVSGVVVVSRTNWHGNGGKLLLTAFLINLGLLLLSKGYGYYYIELYPYAVLGVVLFIQYLAKYAWVQQLKAGIYLAVCLVCVVLCVPAGYTFYNLGRSADQFLAGDVAQDVRTFSTTHGLTDPTLFVYKTRDYGFYNALGQVPTTKYFAQNMFTEESFPTMYQAFAATIEQQTCDFVVTELKTWQAEYDFLSQYYQPFTGDIGSSSYTYHYQYTCIYYPETFVLLCRI